MKSTQLFLLLPLIGALAGCGQIGPLYLPTKATSVPVQPDIKPQPNANQDH
jgi:predicted small lipoprotein YifL